MPDAMVRGYEHPLYILPFDHLETARTH